MTGFRIRTWMYVSFLMILFVACAPTTQGEMQQGQEFVTEMLIDDAYAAAFRAINMEPTPAESSGWIISRADSVNHILSAELSYKIWDWWSGWVGRRAFINVVMADLGSDGAAVQIAGSMSDEYAVAVSGSVLAALGL